MTDALGDAGYTVDRAADGEEALGKLRARTFHLVICDLRFEQPWSWLQ